MTSTDLVVPTSRQAVLALNSQTLYLLERAGEIAHEILDARIVAWTEQGWTQRKIATEIGCAPSVVSERQARLGVRSSDRRGGDRFARQPSKTKNGSAPERRVQRKRGTELEDWLPDMLPGAEPDGAFRQAVKAWCDQERSLLGAMDNTGITLVPKSDMDRDALLEALAAIRTTAARLERQLKP